MTNSSIVRNITDRTAASAVDFAQICEPLACWEYQFGNAAESDRTEIASAPDVTSSPKSRTCLPSVDDVLLTPWVATGVVDPQDARLYAAAVAADPALDDDLAAARAEQAAVVAMGEALGRPSVRPMLALFAAIDAERDSVIDNVTKPTFQRPRAPLAFDTQAASVPQSRKLRCWR